MCGRLALRLPTEGEKDRYGEHPFFHLHVNRAVISGDGGSDIGKTHAVSRGIRLPALKGFPDIRQIGGIFHLQEETFFNGSYGYLDK